MQKEPSFSYVDAQTDIRSIVDILERDGGIIIRGANNDLESFSHEIEPLFSDAAYCIGEFYGSKTKRIHGLIAKSESCRNLALNESVLPVVEACLGRYAGGKIQINLTQGIEIWPGERGQILHRDDSMFGATQKPHEYMVNVMWARTKFTKANGATRAIPGSHRWLEAEVIERSINAQECDIAIAEMDPGDAFIWLGSTIHGGGANNTQQPRSGVVISYSLPWLRQSENQYLAAPWALAKNWPEKLQDMLGYAVCEPNIGMLEGEQPKVVLSKAAGERVVTRDFLTQEQNGLICAYFKGQEADRLQNVA